MYVLRGSGKAKYAVEITSYAEDFGFLKSLLPKSAGSLTMATERLGRAMIVVDTGLTAFQEFQATEGHSALVQIGYTAFETSAKVGGAFAGATTFGKVGVLAGAPFGPVGSAIGGAVFAIGGGIGGAFAADHVTDLIWEVKPIHA